jgi:hypothetical protein
MEEKIPNTKIVLSLAPERADDASWDNKCRTVNSLLTDRYINNDSAVLCLNDNIRIRNGHIVESDGLHLTNSGTSRLAANLKRSLNTSLKIVSAQKSSPRRDRFQGHIDSYGHGSGPFYHGRSHQRVQGQAYRPPQYNRRTEQNDQYDRPNMYHCDSRPRYQNSERNRMLDEARNDSFNYDRGQHSPRQFSFSSRQRQW